MATYLCEGKFATGALPRNPDVRDYRLELLPQVAAQMEVGVPDRFLVLPLEQFPSSLKINQGPVPKCVASSDCHAKTVQEFRDIGAWQGYDDDELYRACGGNGSNGVHTDLSLSYLKNTGALQRNASRRWKIESYLFAPQVRGQFRQTLAAALVATGPCVLAMLLPAPFGWDSGESPTQGYHQMVLWGYEGLADNDYAVFLNSWGEGHGNRGFARVKWGYLEGSSFQNRLCYAYQMTDVREGSTPAPRPEPQPQPRPEPQPSTRVRIEGTVSGGGLEFLKQGLLLQASGGGFSGAVSVTRVEREEEPKPQPDPQPQPEPEPRPEELAVTVSAAAGMLTARATRDGQPVPASFTGTLDGQPLPLKFSGMRFPYSATWGFSRSLSGLSVEIAAVAGVRRGKFRGQL